MNSLNNYIEKNMSSLIGASFFIYIFIVEGPNIAVYSMKYDAPPWVDMTTALTRSIFVCWLEYIITMYATMKWVRSLEDGSLTLSEIKAALPATILSIVFTSSLALYVFIDIGALYVDQTVDKTTGKLLNESLSWTIKPLMESEGSVMNIIVIFGSLILSFASIMFKKTELDYQKKEKEKKAKEEDDKKKKEDDTKKQQNQQQSSGGQKQQQSGGQGGQRPHLQHGHYNMLKDVISQLHGKKSINYTFDTMDDAKKTQCFSVIAKLAANGSDDAAIRKTIESLVPNL